MIASYCLHSFCYYCYHVAYTCHLCIFASFRRPERGLHQLGHTPQYSSLARSGS